jgi:hypothetical protein
MPERMKEQGAIKITWKGLSRTEVDDPYDFLKSHEAVTHVHTRVSTMDAACEPSIHPTAAVIVGFSIVILRTVAREAVVDWIKYWFKKWQQDEGAAGRIVNIYDADHRVVRRVKRIRLPKAK